MWTRRIKAAEDHAAIIAMLGHLLRQDIQVLGV
jgi:hypothetical protein